MEPWVQSSGVPALGKEGEFGGALQRHQVFTPPPGGWTCGQNLLTT